MEVKRAAPTFLLLLVSLALAGGGARQAVTVHIDSPASCRPAVGSVVFGVKPDAEASRRMTQIFTEDQNARGNPNIDWKKVAWEDQKRRFETLNLLKEGRLSSAQDYLGAAFVFQHGECPQHYQLANLLAGQAIARGGGQEARWIYAATYDRWQRSLGLPQKYGTQYLSMGEGCHFQLEEYDLRTTDEERAKYGVPPLKEALARADQLNADCLKNQGKP